MTKLFDGWTRCTIGSLCELINGRAFKPTDWGQTGLPIVRIQNLNNRDANFNYFNGEVRSRFLIDTGALLFAWSGTPGTSFGTHIWTGGPAVLNQHIFHVLFDEDTLDKSFLRFAINQKLDELIDKAHGGVGLRHVTKGKFEATEIDVPSLDEQRLIVTAVDGLLSRSNAAREDLNRIPRLVERYKQAILSAAFRQLSVGVGSRPYETKALGDVCDQERTITYGVIKLGEEVPNGIPCLRTSNVRWLQIDTEGMKRISPALSREYGRTILRGDEVLVNVRGTLGGVAVVTPRMKGWNVSREVAVVPVDTATVDSDYLAYWIASDASQLWLRRVQKGVAYTGINIADLRKLPVDLPSLKRQRQIVLDIRQAHAKISALDQEVGRARALLDRLDQAALEKAFRGELLTEQQRTITEVAVSQ
jgi:type I restriction enzyme S subunit